MRKNIVNWFMLSAVGAVLAYGLLTAGEFPLTMQTISDLLP